MQYYSQYSHLTEKCKSGRYNVCTKQKIRLAAPLKLTYQHILSNFLVALDRTRLAISRFSVVMPRWREKNCQWLVIQKNNFQISWNLKSDCTFTYFVCLFVFHLIAQKLLNGLLGQSSENECGIWIGIKGLMQTEKAKVTSVIFRSGSILILLPLMIS